MSVLDDVLEATSPSGRTKPDLGPAVKDGKLRYLSVSSVTTADTSQDGGCLRKWYLEKVVRLPRPTTRSQELGTRVHAEIEHYLKTGEDVLGPVARIGKHLLPPPRTVETERAIGLDGKGGFRNDLVALGIPFVGFVDAVNLSGRHLDPEGVERADDAPEMLDWKTSKDVARYAKSGSALIRTVQMVGYGKYALDVLAPRAERVRVSHVTFPTEGPKRALKTTAVIDRLTIESRWLKVSDVVAGMVQAATETDPVRVPANFAACGAFGGCPFKGTPHCPRDTKQALRDAFGAAGESFMGALDDVMAKRNEAPPPADPFSGRRPGLDVMPPGLDVAARKAWVKAVQEYQLQELEREEEAEKAGADAEKAEHAKAASDAKTLADRYPPGKPAAAPPKPKATVATTAGAVKASTCRQGKHYLVALGDETYTCQYVARTKGGHAFTHPDLASTIILTDDDLVLLVDTVVPPDLPAAGESGPVATPIPADAVVPANVRAAADKVAPEAPVEAKAKKPRKVKALPEAAKVDPGPAPETPADPDVPSAPFAIDPETRVGLTPKGAEAAAPPSSVGEVYRKTGKGNEDVGHQLGTSEAVEMPGFVLCVDCVPTHGIRARNLAGVVEVVHEAMRETFKCVDARDSSNDRLAFGKWKGALAAGIRAYHEEHPLTGYVVAEAKGSELVAIAVEALAPMAAVVIRGV